MLEFFFCSKTALSGGEPALNVAARQHSASQHELIEADVRRPICFAIIGEFR